MIIAYLADYVVDLRCFGSGSSVHRLDTALVEYCRWLFEVPTPDLLGEGLADGNYSISYIIRLLLVASEAVEDLKILDEQSPTGKFLRHDEVKSSP